MEAVLNSQQWQLNDQQECAARFGITSGEGKALAGNSTDGPLLVLAGAGTGKTTTIAHRVGNLLCSGVAPERILLMTFSRRAAREMTARACRVVAQSAPDKQTGRHSLRWAGTYHSIANRLLRHYARHVGLQPEFSILDRGDAADLMDVCRQALDLPSLDKRFPRKDACLDIYSQCTNRQEQLDKVVARDFPWCENWQDELRDLFREYVQLKQKTLSMDYDDLLLYWHFMMKEEWLAEEVGSRFDHVLVDEYQDTNVLQAAILHAMKPDGRGVTVVGDDAQSIYSFRAAEVENIRNFSNQYSGPVEIINLETNYRSHQRILDFANALMSEEQTEFSRNLRSPRSEGDKPAYVTVEDDYCQVQYVVGRILQNREDGMKLMDQAVLFRNSHHSDGLEVELARRNIPFVKYGGLKFLEAHHVKDVLCLLRWSINPKDQLAAFRSMQLLAGIGPALANKAWQQFTIMGCSFKSLCEVPLPDSRVQSWLELCDLMVHCAENHQHLSASLQSILEWYRPHMERRFADAAIRWPDLGQLLQISSGYQDTENFLADLALDPPVASGDQAGDPLKDEDYLILSTVHSAKGQEWSSVFLLNVVDGSFPSEFSTGDDRLIEEERRLLYVAGTRAKDQLHLIAPLKFYIPQQRKHGNQHVYGAQSRFMTDAVMSTCKRRFFGETQASKPLANAVRQLDIPGHINQIW